MGRKFDHVDVMAAIGLVATLFGGYLFVTAADGFWQAPSINTMTTAVSVMAHPPEWSTYNRYWGRPFFRIFCSTVMPVRQYQPPRWN